MKIFVCSPPTLGERVRAYIRYLESNGHSVVSLQSPELNKSTSEETCVAALLAMSAANEVQVAWDGQDQGVLFFLGAAFALGKAVRLIPFLTPCLADNGPKFFIRLMQWMDGNEWWKKINRAVIENKRKEQEQKGEVV